MYWASIIKSNRIRDDYHVKNFESIDWSIDEEIRTRRCICIGALALSLMILPFTFISIVIGICVRSVSFADILIPITWRRRQEPVFHLITAIKDSELRYLHTLIHLDRKKCLVHDVYSSHNPLGNTDCESCAEKTSIRSAYQRNEHDWKTDTFRCRVVFHSDIDLHRYHRSAVSPCRNRVVHSFHFDHLRKTKIERNQIDRN